jgi:hypothetical protein
MEKLAILHSPIVASKNVLRWMTAKPGPFVASVDAAEAGADDSSPRDTLRILRTVTTSEAVEGVHVFLADPLSTRWQPRAPKSTRNREASSDHELDWTQAVDRPRCGGRVIADNPSRRPRDPSRLLDRHASIYMRPPNRLLRCVVVGAAAGYLADRCMEVATSACYALQSDESKAREEEVLPGGAIVATGRSLATVMKMDADSENVRRLGMVAHAGVAITYGVIAALLAGAGVRPFRAGALTAVTAFVLVDEALNAVRLEPSPFDFPIEAHMRGAVGHATFGAALGGALSAAEALLDQQT